MNKFLNVGLFNHLEIVTVTLKYYQGGSAPVFIRVVFWETVKSSIV